MNKVKEMEITNEVSGPTGAYTPTKTIDIYLCERKISTIAVEEGKSLPAYITLSSSGRETILYPLNECKQEDNKIIVPFEAILKWIQ